MAKVVDQEIPSEMLSFYLEHLAATYVNPLAPDEGVVQAHGGGKSTVSPSASQLSVRQAFIDSCECWWLQQEDEGAIPPEVGPRPLWWWYEQAEAAEMMVFHYYMSLSIGAFYYEEYIPWCVEAEMGDSTIDSYYPDNNYGDTSYLEADSYYFGDIKRFLVLRSSADVGKAYLNLYVIGAWFAYSEANMLQCYSTNPDTFEEMGVTWNNQPSMVGLLDQKILSPTPAWFKFNVGSANSILFKIIVEYNEFVEDIGGCTIASREHSTTGWRPFFSST